MLKKNSQRKTILAVLSFLLLFHPIDPLPAQASDQNFIDPTTGIEFILIPGGCFEMGNKWGDGSYTEYPVHEVCVDSYYLGKTEVTQGQWQTLLGSNPSTLKLGGDYPVETISREDVGIFLQKMGQDGARKYRLPTEAEWESACRSGGQDQQYCGGNSPDDFAWHDSNSDDGPHPVAQKKPNGLGLYDMSGNVWEYCSDIYAKDYYKNSPRQNPTGAESGWHYITRGGSWSVNENFQRSTTRGRVTIDQKNYSTGFRVAFSADQANIAENNQKAE